MSRRVVRVRGVAGKQLDWICRVLDTDAETFINEIIPFHVKIIEQQGVPNESNAVPEESSGASTEETRSSNESGA